MHVENSNARGYSRMKSAIRITLIYVVFSSLWILLSDKAVLLVSDNPDLMTFYSSVKGLFFVVTTGALLFALIYREGKVRDGIIRELDKGVDVRSQLIQELHHRIKNNLQAILGLIRIDAHNRMRGKEDGIEIENKLLSMQAVYNVVYDYGDMDSISLANVLREYAVIVHRPISVTGDDATTATIETMVTLLLVIDGIFEKTMKAGVAGDVEVSINPGNITLAFPRPVGRLAELMESDFNFFDLFMKSLKGNMRVDDNDGRCVILEYFNRGDSNLKQ